ncbi:hypothetical protein SPM90_07825 [Enterobacter kobei]|nr:hypothetical protein [Enterobacter kobei]
MSNIDKRATELLIENGVLVADTLRHLADNEIDSDYFAICHTNENGTEIECELAITDYARQAAGTVDELVKALEAAEERITDGENRIRKQNRHVCDLFDDNTALRQRIIELEEKLQTADKLQDSAFRHGLQHGFSFGQTDNQAGFEECLLAYSQKEKSNG